MALAALALVVFGAYDSYPTLTYEAVAQRGRNAFSRRLSIPFKEKSMLQKLETKQEMSKFMRGDTGMSKKWKST